MLSIVAALLAVVVAVSLITGDRAGFITQLQPVAVDIAAAVAVTATLGSLYLSEVEGYEPCRLCWVQRGFMYPAAGLLLIALISKSLLAVRAAGVLALVGLPVALFHRYEQAAGEVGGFCEAENPCNLRWVEQFGFITIPTMAAAGFAAVVALCFLALRKPAVP